MGKRSEERTGIGDRPDAPSRGGREQLWLGDLTTRRGGRSSDGSGCGMADRGGPSHPSAAAVVTDLLKPLQTEERQTAVRKRLTH